MKKPKPKRTVTRKPLIVCFVDFDSVGLVMQQALVSGLGIEGLGMRLLDYIS